MSGKRYLFAGGCPRSGTTVLARVLNCHRRIALGIERFQRHFAEETLTPDLFEAPRFWTFAPEDSRRWEKQESAQAETLRAGYGSAVWIGDKNPTLWKHYDMLFGRFPKARVVYVLRNPFSMASSCQTRFDDPDDKFPIDAARAVRDWNRSLRATLDALGKGHDITVVSFEEDFASLEAVGRIYTALGLDPDEADKAELSRLLAEFDKNARDLRDKHDNVAKHVSLHAKFNLYRTLLNEHSLFAQAAGKSTSEEMVHA